MSIKRNAVTAYDYQGAITIGVIPDTHWDPDDKKNAKRVITAVGEMMKREDPDVLIHLGDGNDLGSLSSYDRGKKTIEGKRLKRDLSFSRDCLALLDDTLGDIGADRYITLGNHEDRLTRAYNDLPQLADIGGNDPFGYEEHGWEVIPFLEMLSINDVYFSHYFQNPASVMGTPIGGSIETALKNLGHSFVQGHVQTLRQGQMHRGTGDIHCGLILGACYLSDHSYKGPQGNRHFRGAAVLRNVNNGYYDAHVTGLRTILKDAKQYHARTK